MEKGQLVVLVKHCRQCPITSENLQGVSSNCVIDDSAATTLNHSSTFVSNRYSGLLYAKLNTLCC